MPEPDEQKRFEIAVFVVTTAWLIFVFVYAAVWPRVKGLL